MIRETAGIPPRRHARVIFYGTKVFNLSGEGEREGTDGFGVYAFGLDVRRRADEE